MNHALIQAIAEVALVFLLMAIAAYIAFIVGRQIGTENEKSKILGIIDGNTTHLTSFNVDLRNDAETVNAIQAECESPTYSGLINYED